MGRKKNNDVQELLVKAEKEFKGLPNNKTYFRLNTVINCLKNNIKSVSIITGIEIRTLFRWLSKYRKEGINGLIDKAKGHNPSKLNENQKKEIQEWIMSRKYKGKQIHWTLNKLQETIKKEFKIKISKTPLWLQLKAMGLSRRSPRPEHNEKDKEKYEDFKKKRKK